MKRSMDIQITSGRGPAECCWVVARVLREMMAEARTAGVAPFVLLRETGPEPRTLYSARLRLYGTQEQTSRFVRSWRGTIQWVGQSPYRRHHRRKNWYVGVEVIDGDTTCREVDERDIRYEAIRSGGPGGQHVNKVSTAVRALHLPTGIQVVASDSRSQHQNKKSARLRLQAKLQESDIAKAQRSAESTWRQHDALKRGDPIRIYIGKEFRLKNGGSS